MRRAKQLACLRSSARVFHLRGIHVYKNMIVPSSAFSESTYYNKWIGKRSADDGAELIESGFKGEFDFG